MTCPNTLTYICGLPRFRPNRRDAAALACSCASARAAFPQSKWFRSVRIGPSGAVLEPLSGAFDVTVAPGEGVQAAVDACPRGGCVLLQPGTHEGPLVLSADQEVHVFGRGEALLRVGSSGTVLTSLAAMATLDGLALRREVGGSLGDCGVSIKGGRLRLQACDVFNATGTCICVEGGAEPVMTSCRCAPLGD